MQQLNGSVSLCAIVVKALETAKQHGFNVIAVKNKQPVVGWKSAQDAQQTDEQRAEQRRLIESCQGGAIALVGGVNGLVAIDIDAVDKSSPIPETFVQRVIARLGLARPYAWCWRSLSGAGWHLWVTVTDLPRGATRYEVDGDGFIWRAMEIRAWKHYTVIPPNIELPNDPPAAVTWGTLCAALGVTEKQNNANNSHNNQNGHNRVIKINNRALSYGEKALQSEAEQVAAAPQGQRNSTLNRAAYAIGRKVAAGLIDEHDAVQQLKQAALAAGLSEHETVRTIQSGLTAGINEGPPDSLPNFEEDDITKRPTASLALALEKAGYWIEQNEETGEVTVNGKKISDEMLRLMRSYVRDFHLGKPQLLEDAIALLANLHKISPIRDGLSNLQWDGESHIARLAECLKTNSDDVITYKDGTRRRAAEVFLTRWLLGAVGRVFNQEQNLMLVLDGPQGVGKSSFVHWLGSVIPQARQESNIDPHNKDCLLRLTRTLVWEVTELDATTRRHDVSALKAFLTLNQVTVRPAYGRSDITQPALASFIGTVNSSGNGFLPDPTGNRRYMVISLTDIDWAYQEIDVNQVWAEAVARWRNGERGMLTREEAMYRDQVNAEQHQLSGLMDDWLLRYFEITKNDEDLLTFSEIADHLAAHDLKLNPNERSLAMSIAEALTRAGVKRANRRASQAKYGDHRRAWAGIRIRRCSKCNWKYTAEPTVPTLNQPIEKVGSEHSNAVSSPSEPTVPTLEGKFQKIEAVEIFGILDDEVGSVGSQQSLEHQNAVNQPTTGLVQVGSEAPAVGSSSIKVGSFPPYDGFVTDNIGPIYGERDQGSTEHFNGYLALQQKLHGTGWEVFPDYSEGLAGLYAGNRKKKLRTRTYECQTASDYVRVICNAIKCIDSDAFNRGQSELF